MSQILMISISILVLGTANLIYTMNSVPDPPEIDTQRSWGADIKNAKGPDAIREFKVEINESTINDLRKRIKNRRPFVTPLLHDQSQYGINTKYLETLMDYWHDKYDFQGRIERLNRFRHFKTNIQGLDIHFIKASAKPKNGETVLPLLLLHGWPSSSKEFDMVIPIYTEPKPGYDFVFEVIAPDLPGFGFSEGTNKKGLNAVQIAIIMRNLMKRLNYHKFYIQAGDWGSQVATHLATMFQEDVLGFHTNMPLSSTRLSSVKLLLGSLFPSLLVEPENMDRIYPLSKLMNYILYESGYFHIQSTKPDTIGVALTDSPAGLAAYLIEKVGICSNRDQTDTPHSGIENLDLDDVFDTITIVWINNCIVTSMRLYTEGMSFQYPEISTLHRTPLYVPTAAINFRYEVLYQPDWILRDKFYNLVRSTTLPFGGHFAALQTPKELADDVFESVKTFIQFHNTTKITFKNLIRDKPRNREQ